MPDAPQGGGVEMETRGIEEMLERCKVLGISATRYLFTHSEVTALIAAVRADERATLASQADAGDREWLEPLLLPPHWFACLVYRPERHGGPAECDCNRGKAAAAILSRLAALRAARDALAQRVGEVEGTGAGVIAAERRRQTEVEGWTPGHDDAHTDGSLARAAAIYAWGQERPLFVKKAWPWSTEWFKPEFLYWRYHPPVDRGERSVGDVDPFSGGVVPESLTEARVRVLAKAGALIAAEIDRLNRAALAGRKGVGT